MRSRDATSVVTSLVSRASVSRATRSGPSRLSGASVGTDKGTGRDLRILEAEKMARFTQVTVRIAGPEVKCKQLQATAAKSHADW